MSNTSPAKEIQNKMTKHAPLIKRFQAMNERKIDIWCPSNDKLVNEGLRLSQQITKRHWVHDSKFNGGKFFKKVGVMSTNHKHDTSWFNIEDKEDSKTGLWIESKEQLEEKLEQIEANLQGLKSKIVENESKISKTIDVAGGMHDLMKMTIDTEKEAALVQVICDQLSELEALCLESDLATLCLQKE